MNTFAKLRMCVFPYLYTNISNLSFVFITAVTLSRQWKRSTAGIPPPNYWRTSRKLKNTFHSCIVSWARPLKQYRYQLSNSAQKTGNLLIKIYQKYPSHLFIIFLSSFADHSRHPNLIRGLDLLCGKSLFCVYMAVFYISLVLFKVFLHVSLQLVSYILLN